MVDFLDKVKQLLLQDLSSFFQWLGKLKSVFAHLAAVGDYYSLLVRWLLPVLAVIIFLWCILPLLRDRKNQTTWGYLYLMNGIRVPIQSWECMLGRGKNSDIMINQPFISRNHAVLTYHNGVWSIADLGSKGGITVNGARVEEQHRLAYGDVISLAGIEMALLPADIVPAEEGQEEQVSDNSGVVNSTGTFTLLLIFIFQLLGALQIIITRSAAVFPMLPVTVFALMLAQGLHYHVLRWLQFENLELVLLSYFLCGLNVFIVASAAPHSLYKQLVAILLGMAVFTIFSLLIRKIGRAMKLKYFLLAGALVLLVLNLTLGEIHFGAKNWINLGFITFQPMELVKVAFVLAGTATLDRLLTTRNMAAFIGFTGACMLTLVLIRDFGSAVVFFGAFVVMAFMQSGDLRSLALVLAGALFGGFAVVAFVPYVTKRFAVWGKVWQYAGTTGYQQTRTMIAAASGGLLGVGGGSGYLVNVAAADTDLVFGVLCEEWGLLIALLAVLVIVFFAVYTVIIIKSSLSSFYAIAACGAATIFLLQTALNVLGSVDILPLTGVTIPFVSNGGTSMLTSWALLAFIYSVK
ncbi:MAG: FtsW/RodA/SpoVE family cell cycle protein [Firmicutes bacterium]|jgi:cell division protein FtsW (lipid II flippase)|nr:FtsW/RodA/SpoVE family cell cycle protein [Bacillota bacterium]